MIVPCPVILDVRDVAILFSEEKSVRRFHIEVNIVNFVSLVVIASHDNLPQKFGLDSVLFNEITKLDFRFQVKSISNLTSRLSVESRRIFSITFNAVSILRNL